MAQIQTSTTPAWDIPVGSTLRRRQVHDRFGGQQQGGISTPAASENILIFTDPARSRTYGYDLHEGPRPDGLYAYTGQGQRGDQTFTLGNKALRDTNDSGKIIRLFSVKGVNATYVGAFTLADPPYTSIRIPDLDGDDRLAILFLLAPLDADLELIPQVERTASKPCSDRRRVCENRAARE